MSHELTDLHNQRKNIEYVSKHAKLAGTPLLAWPEDRTLLKLSDLPILETQVNKPVDWSTMDAAGSFIVSSDAELQTHLTPGKAYAIVAYFQGGFFEVQAWTVASR